MSSEPKGRSFLGISLGATAGTVTLSLFAWPIADLLIAPSLIADAMKSACPTSSQSVAMQSVDAAAAELALRKQLSSARARICVLTGGTQERRSALAHGASSGRPTTKISLREACSPHSMQMSLIEQLYRPLGLAPVFSCLGVFWLSLFDMLISDHAHTRHRDFCVVLGQLRRALHRLPPASAEQSRPLIIVEHMYVPVGASTDVGGEGIAPMLRSLRQFLCAVSIDEGSADVLVLAPHGTAAAESAASAWRGAARKTCADRATLGDGLVVISLTQSEAADQWLDGIRLMGATRAPPK